jgi:hypothetical protein
VFVLYSVHLFISCVIVNLNEQNTSNSKTTCTNHYLFNLYELYKFFLYHTVDIVQNMLGKRVWTGVDEIFGFTISLKEF